MLSFILIIINIGFIPNNIGYFVLVLYELFYYQMATKKQITVNFIKRNPVWLLAISGLIYAIASNVAMERSLVTSTIIYCVLPVLIFVSGYTITNKKLNISILSVESSLCAIAVGCALHVVLNIFINLNIVNRSETVDFFTGKLAATNLGSLNTYIFALLPCLIITRRRKIKIFGLVFFLLSVVYSLILGTRTTIYALIIMTTISAFIYIKKHYSKGIKVNVIIKRFLIVAIIFGIIYLVYSNDFLSIRSKIETSTLARRYGNKATDASDSIRFYYFCEGIKYLFEHPFGGNKAHGISYFHNYWLDVARVAGIIPVVLIVIMDIILFGNMMKIFKNRDIDEDFRYAIFGI